MKVAHHGTARYIGRVLLAFSIEEQHKVDMTTALQTFIQIWHSRMSLRINLNGFQPHSLKDYAFSAWRHHHFVGVSFKMINHSCVLRNVTPLFSTKSFAAVICNARQKAYRSTPQ
jgi:hypothetical protein